MRQSFDLTVRLKIKIHPRKVWKVLNESPHPMSESELMQELGTDNHTTHRALGLLFAAGKVGQKVKRKGPHTFVVWEARDRPPKKKYGSELKRKNEKRKENYANKKRAETFGVDDTEWTLLKSDYHDGGT